MAMPQRPPTTAWNGEPSPEIAGIGEIDRAYLVETLSRLATVPTDVPLGFDTLIEPDHPKLVHYVQDVIRPELVRIGYYDLVDAPRNNLVVRVGSGVSGRSLLILNYTAVQHYNLMEDPFSGKVGSAREFGLDEPAVYGQGVSQSKAHQTAMLAVLKLLAESGVQLRGRLYWGVNNEGRSSHDCSEAIIGTLEEKPSFCVLQTGTSHRIQLGNRGRVDVDVHIEGKACHSSRPQEGLGTIEAAYDFMSRLRDLSWPDRHPLLGGRHAIVYKMRFAPEAPHTLPSDAYLTLDRRLLPGDDPDGATSEIREAIGDMSPYSVSIERGVFMLPALIDPDHPGVKALKAAHLATFGTQAETFYAPGTFDLGGPTSLGVPSVQYGARGVGEWPLGSDVMPIAWVEQEANVLARLILDQLS
jgi:acetylornithine deacetylase/succinyl-diaminopimelate desuccinylase-like protein